MVLPFLRRSMLPCELDDDDERHHIAFKLFSSVDHNGSLQLEPVQSLHTHKVTNLYRRLGQGSAPCLGQVSKPSLTVLKAQERNLDVRRKTAHSLAPNLHLADKECGCRVCSGSGVQLQQCFRKERHLCSCIGHPNLHTYTVPRLTKRFCRDDDVRPPDRYYVLMEVRNHLLLAFYMMKAQRHKMQYHRGCHVYLVEANRRRH
jgi:hypothetical protein